jgi:MerR family transcriptional regulator/heat shock protein HspR
MGRPPSAVAEQEATANPAGAREGCYVISVAADMLGVHPQTLRHYERLGLVSPERTNGNIRLYSAQDIARLRRVQQLMDDLGVNLAGVEVILRLHDHIEQLQRDHAERLEALRESYENELRRLRSVLARVQREREL